MLCVLSNNLSVFDSSQLQLLTLTTTSTITSYNWAWHSSAPACLYICFDLNIFLTKIFLDPNFFLDTKYFWPQNFRTQNFVGLKVIWHQNFWTCILWAQIFSKTKINLRVEFDSGVGPTCFIWICAKSLGIKKCQRKYQGYFKGQHFCGLILFAKKILNKIICEKKDLNQKILWITNLDSWSLNRKFHYYLKYIWTGIGLFGIYFWIEKK